MIKGQLISWMWYFVCFYLENNDSTAIIQKQMPFLEYVERFMMDDGWEISFHHIPMKNSNNHWPWKSPFQDCAISSKKGHLNDCGRNWSEHVNHPNQSVNWWCYIDIWCWKSCRILSTIRHWSFFELTTNRNVPWLLGMFMAWGRLSRPSTRRIQGNAMIKSWQRSKCKTGNPIWWTASFGIKAIVFGNIYQKAMHRDSKATNRKEQMLPNSLVVEDYLWGYNITVVKEKSDLVFFIENVPASQWAKVNPKLIT